MGEDEPFLRALLLNPEDATRSVYADWLEERGDERAEYLRLERDLAALPAGDANVPAWGRRLAELRARIEPAWLARVGSPHASATSRSGDAEPDAGRLERAASLLGRLVAYVDEEGYERKITAAAEHPVTGALAYVECRSRWRGDVQDIHFHLRIPDGRGGDTAWEPTTYNPFFGCRVRFLEWYGDTVLFIYREKHSTYASRFGPAFPAQWQRIKDDWVLAGPQLGYWGYKETSVRRLAIPSLAELPPVSEAEAAARGLLPAKFW